MRFLRLGASSKSFAAQVDTTTAVKSYLYFCIIWRFLFTYTYFIWFLYVLYFFWWPATTGCINKWQPAVGNVAFCEFPALVHKKKLAQLSVRFFYSRQFLFLMFAVGQFVD